MRENQWDNNTDRKCPNGSYVTYKKVPKPNCVRAEK